MNIILFTHPDFTSSESMPRFATMIVHGMRKNGHTVSVWSASPFFYNLPAPARLKKWLGYVDQFIVFPLQAKVRIKHLTADTLFVFSDQALGPWVPLVVHRPHVVHVHDFMALRSALNEYPKNPTGWSGQQYQAMIRRGFGHGKNFISVSKKTQSDLARFLPAKPPLSEVVYNGLNFPFRAMSCKESIALLSPLGVAIPSDGFLIHVGGNQWYKNREGVLELYEAYVKRVKQPLPLWMVGSSPTQKMRGAAQRIGVAGSVHFLSNLSNEQVCAAYSLASMLLFPSLAEGFGWPIAEAMACGCMVLTTGEAPMTEVGGDAAFYISNKAENDAFTWANKSAQVLESALHLSPEEKQLRRANGFAQADKFDSQQTIYKYEAIYQRIVTDSAV
jgi:glycosyltransferase involved in cell wall biosynthesis